MPDVEAVSVSPTRAVPEMVGLPVAGELEASSLRMVPVKRIVLGVTLVTSRFQGMVMVSSDSGTSSSRIVMSSVADRSPAGTVKNRFDPVMKLS